MDLGHSGHLTLDAGGSPQFKENTVDNVVPQFLKDDPYPNLDRGVEPYQKQALDLFKAGKPFMLDIDQATQQVVAREVTQISVQNYNKPPSYQNSAAGAVLSLLA
jgi:hypothetical protein